MNVKDRERLRYLAAHQLEIANSPKNLERVELWKRHNMYKGERPPIHIEALNLYSLSVLLRICVCLLHDTKSIKHITPNNIKNLFLSMLQKYIFLSFKKRLFQ